MLGHAESLFTQPWPEADAAALVKKEVTLVVQVDGKVRSRLQVDVDTPNERIQRLALADDRVQPWVRERAVERVVIVANRLVNIVTRA
jgi:leucyl-tRNA synthetase